MIWAVVVIAIVLVLAFMAWVWSMIPEGEYEIAGRVEWEELEVAEIAASYPPGSTYADVPEVLRPRLLSSQLMGENELLTRDGRDS